MRVSISSTMTEHTNKRPTPQRINKINSKSKEADAMELDRLLARRGNCKNVVYTPDEFAWIKMQRKQGIFLAPFKNTFPSAQPPPPADICISVCWTLNSCVFPVSFSTQRVHVWVRATGWPDTQWQTRPWADRTNAITPHAAPSAAAQNTAISYLSRQLCLRRGIEKEGIGILPHKHIIGNWEEG